MELFSNRFVARVIQLTEIPNHLIVMLRRKKIAVLRIINI